MRKLNRLKIFFLIMISCFLNGIIYSQVPDFLDSSYVPVFQDEFTGTSLDYNKWQRLFPWGPSFTDTNVTLVSQAVCGVPANTYANLAYDEYRQSDTNFVKVNGGSAKIYVKKQNYT